MDQGFLGWEFSQQTKKELAVMDQGMLMNSKPCKT